MRTTVRSTTLSLFLSLGLLVLGAASASAFSTNMTSNYGGGVLTTSDTVTVTVEFDTEGANNLAVLSVSVLFDDQIMAWNQGASQSPSYALYAGRGGYSFGNLSTNMTLRTGTADQILLDWSSDGLLAGAGTTVGCGPFGTYPPDGGPSGSTCGMTMATLVFHVISQDDGEAAFTLSNSSPGNILQLIDNSQPANPVSGDFLVQTPEPTTALLVGLGLAGLGVAGRRRS